MMSTALLGSLWQGAFVVAIAALATMLAPQRHAATRYAIWFAAMLALAIVPAIASWHPAQSIASLPVPVERTEVVTTLVTASAANAGGGWLVLIWLAGTSLSLLRLMLSYLRINRIIRTSTPVLEFGSNVLASEALTFPIAAGIVKPVIIIPTDLVETLERSDLEAIVQHERAHISRGDIITNAIARIVEGALFFNPWTYVVGRQLIKEREAACDDWVVNATGEPDRYAACLARLAQRAPRARTPLLTPSAIGSRRMLVGRIARLLDGKAAQVKINFQLVALSIAFFGILAVALQTPSGLASVGGVVAANPSFPPNCYHDVKILNAAAPNIPAAAYRPNLEADALVTVDVTGRPIGAKIVKSSGNTGVDRATVNAAMASTYSPEVSHCKAKVGRYLFHVETGS
jgi:beta-lactamase regulating signal transducer with metallopeptidase domain